MSVTNAGTTTGPQLFPEIVEAILDYFNTEEQADRLILRECSQVSKHFAIKAQTMLFREIRIIDDEVLANLYGNHNRPASITKRCKWLSEIMDRKPYLASSIQTVSITLGPMATWISHDVEFIAVMERLARPESRFNTLLLRGTSDSVRIADNRAFEKNVLIPFIAPRLTSLHIFLLSNAPIALISECPHLVELNLTHAQAERISSLPRRSSKSPRPTIQRLRVKNSRAMLALLTSHPVLARPFANFNALVEYSDEASGSWDFEAVYLVLMEAKNTLKVLKIMPPSDQGSLQATVTSTMPEYYLNIFRTFDFSQTQKLEKIHISVVFGDHHGPLVANLVQSFGSVSAPNVLQQIELTFHLRADSQATTAALSSAAWSSLRRDISRIAGDNSFKFILNFRAGHLPLSLNTPRESPEELKTIRELLAGEIDTIHSKYFQPSAEQPGLQIEVSCTMYS
ncbi:hypothetical protein CVT24_000145 [Panaeolus cyanescens]|uniref:F-box domain-containing protein n=1 Tax=Panaeolus cyanescens TaxID=181874 RepID=A0A409WBV2_9AGAR|nr:hypothetical protein CVT24_000145 [Panaeolus cyanescens]